MLAIEVIGAVATVLAVTGVVFNNHKMIACFPIWVVSNSLSLGVHATVGVWSLVARDAIFLALAIHGLRCWTRKDGTR